MKNKLIVHNQKYRR